HLDVSGKLAAQRVEDLPHILSQAERLQIQRLVTAEPEEFVGQLRAALSRFLQLIEVTARRGGLGERGGPLSDGTGELTELLPNRPRQAADPPHPLALHHGPRALAPPPAARAPPRPPPRPWPHTP